MAKSEKHIPWKLIIYVFLFIVIGVLAYIFWPYLKAFFEAVGALGALWAAATLAPFVADIIALVFGFLGATGTALYASGKAFINWYQNKQDSGETPTDDEVDTATENAESLKSAITEAGNMDPDGSGQFVIEGPNGTGTTVEVTLDTMDEATDSVNSYIEDNNLMDSSDFDISFEAF